MRSKVAAKKPLMRFEAVKIEPLFAVLDAIAWLDAPTVKHVAQFADIDQRTAAKILHNALLVGLVQSADGSTYVLGQPYPFKGKTDEKRSVVREALLRFPLVRSMRQFMALGDDLPTSMRKAAVVEGEVNYDRAAIAPLVNWAHSIAQVFDLDIRVETLVNAAVQTKITRHAEHRDERIAFISHSSRDKPFVRMLAADLVSNGIRVWLDEQQILIGDSIPEKIAQGLAESDYFLLVVSHNSVQSPWVKKELSSALVREIERRNVVVMPIRLDDAEIPVTVSEKLYADFRGSYDTGVSSLIASIKKLGA